MSVTRLNGATVEFASAYAASRAMTAITNASEAVATLEAAHGIAQGEYFEVLTSGWDRLQGILARAKTVATNDVTLEGINTASTSRYPASQGAGTVREISTWTAVTQVFQDSGVAVSGGEQQFDTYGFMASDIQIQSPTNKSPIVATIKVYHDPALAWVALAQARDILDETTAVRITTRSGGRILLNGYMRLGVPVAEGSFWARTITLSAVNVQTEYAT
jgi:hypothetical protein